MPAVGRHERRPVEIRLFARVIRRSVNRRLIDQTQSFDLERIRVVIVRHHAIHHKIDELNVGQIESCRQVTPCQRKGVIFQRIGHNQIEASNGIVFVNDLDFNLRLLAGPKPCRSANSEDKLGRHRQTGRTETHLRKNERILRRTHVVINREFARTRLDKRHGPVLGTYGHVPAVGRHERRPVEVRVFRGVIGRAFHRRDKIKITPIDVQGHVLLLPFNHESDRDNFRQIDADELLGQQFILLPVILDIRQKDLGPAIETVGQFEIDLRQIGRQTGRRTFVVERKNYSVREQRIEIETFLLRRIGIVISNERAAVGAVERQVHIHLREGLGISRRHRRARVAADGISLAGKPGHRRIKAGGGRRKRGRGGIGEIRTRKIKFSPIDVQLHIGIDAHDHKSESLDLGHIHIVEGRGHNLPGLPRRADPGQKDFVLYPVDVGHFELHLRQGRSAVIEF